MVSRITWLCWVFFWLFLIVLNACPFHNMQRDRSMDNNRSMDSSFCPLRDSQYKQQVYRTFLLSPDLMKHNIYSSLAVNTQYTSWTYIYMYLQTSWLCKQLYILHYYDYFWILTLLLNKKVSSVCFICWQFQSIAVLIIKFGQNVHIYPFNNISVQMYI